MSRALNIISQNLDAINRFEHETKIAENDEENKKMRGELEDIKSRLNTNIK